MFLCLSDRNNVVKLVARGVNDENNHIIPKPQRLQPQFTICIASILAGNSEPLENRLAADKVKAVVPDIAQALRFIKADHE
ncbi:MAG: hypothetical protein ABL923_05405 [Burkholderiaceae bacterium]